MRYLLVIYGEPERWEAMPAAEQESVLGLHAELVEELRRSGELLCGAGLAAPADTTLVASDADAPVPPADRLQMSAFYLLDVPTLERARTLANTILDPHVRLVEVRPVHTVV